MFFSYEICKMFKGYAYPCVPPKKSTDCFHSALYICLTRARNGVCRYVGYCDFFRSEVYNKIEILRGKNPTEIHSALSEVCGEFTVVRSKVYRWVNRFRGGCVSIDNDQKPGRPRTSDEISVKLMADALEEDRPATCEELSRATGGKTSQENVQEPTSGARGRATHSL